MEKDYHLTILETCTQDQWHDVESLFITVEEYQLIKEALDGVVASRRRDSLDNEPVSQE